MAHLHSLTAKQRLSGISWIAGLVLMTVSGGISGAITGQLIEKTISPHSIWTEVELVKNRLINSQPVNSAPALTIAPAALDISRQEIAQLQRQQAKAAAAAEQKRLTYTAPDQFHGAVVKSGQLQMAHDAIALTFDDGPWPTTTQQILDILQQEDIKATFFWVGQAVQSQPEIARQVVNAGHAIGNHTWHHRYELMDAATAASEIEVAARIFNEATGIHTTLFRPPGGYLDNGMADYAESQGYTVVLWSVASADTDSSSDAQAYVNNVLAAAQPGAIILMHDGGGDRSKTVAALPSIIHGLKARGYRFVTVPDLLKLQASGW